MKVKCWMCQSIFARKPTRMSKHLRYKGLFGNRNKGVSMCQKITRVVILDVWRPFGKWAGRQPCPLRPIWIGRGIVDREILFQIYFIIVTFLIVAYQRSGWQFVVAIQGSTPGANQNNCGCRRERARTRTAWDKPYMARKRVESLDVDVRTRT